MIQLTNDLLPFHSDRSTRAIEAFFRTSTTLCLSGPRNCSKTALIILCLLRLHSLVPGLKSLIVRSEFKTIQDTVVPSIKKLLALPLNDPNQEFYCYGGEKNPTHFVWRNTGITTLAGMDSPKFLGGEYDLCWYNQIERETNEMAYSDIMGCMTGGRAGNWYGAGGDPRFLFVADANPGSPAHWWYRMKDKMDWFDFKHSDSPILHNGVRYTKRGVSTREGIRDAYPPGHARDRMYSGIWTAAEGQVYSDWDPDVHVQPLDIDDFGADTVWRSAWDFGRTTSVCLFAQQGQTHYLFRELYLKDVMLADAITMFQKLVSELGVTIKESIVDHAFDSVAQLRKAGLRPVLAKKDVLDGIEIMKKTIYDGRLIVNEDTGVDTGGFKEEILSYQYPEAGTGGAREDHPTKKFDHAMDAARYYLKRVEKRDVYIPKTTFVDVPPAKRGGVFL